MKRAKEILVTLGVGLLSWALGFCAFYPVGYILAQIIYPALNEWAPALFPIYNPVTEHEAYELLNADLSLSAAVLAILLISYLTVRFDNRRFEAVITETEGLYTLSEGAAFYYPRFALGDGLAAAVMALPLPIGALFIPEEIPELLSLIVEPLLAMTAVFTDRFGLVLGIFLIALTVFASRLISAPVALRRWRAVWLSDISVVS